MLLKPGGRRPVGYLHSQYACKVFDLAENAVLLHSADPDKASKTELKKLARRGLLRRLELPLTTLNNAVVPDPAWTLVATTQDEIAALIEERWRILGRTSGRGRDVTPKTAWKVWGDAGGYCMYAGCGEDLRGVPLYNAPARIGYLAHIIASDPDGPRGTQADSHRLADHPDNIMLMCDAHHRLIDCFATEDHPADMLSAMRQTHCDLVNQHLGALAFPRARAITLHANLAHIPTYFHDNDFMEAMLERKRAMLPGVVHYIRRTQRDDRRSPEFWVQYLNDHKLDIHRLVASFGELNAANLEELAVFPLHHIATMVLAGRIMGEARPIRVFQYHRERRTWKWDMNATAQPTGTFHVQGLVSRQAPEVLLTIELSSELDQAALPKNLSAAVADGRMPWVRITTPTPDSGCIRHPDDIDQFMRAARRAINHIQDVIRASKLHLVALSPASTVFCFGQMLQAGHHPTYTIYDRASRDVPFCEALSISGHEVTASAGPLKTKIEIR